MEAVRHGHEQGHRLVHDDVTHDGLGIATAERLLAEAGINVAELVDSDVSDSTER